MANRHKVGIIGTGFVGMAAAYSIFQQKLARELILVDQNRSKAEGEALDMMHGQSLVGRCSVQAGDYADLQGSGLIVICAGISQSGADESRLELLQKNIRIFKDIADKLDHYAPDALLLIASNPVDILTQAMQCLSQRPRKLVIGTGTFLDTSRFRTLLAEYYEVSPRSVHAYILGEHGDSEVPLWSSASIGGLPILNNTINGKPFDTSRMDDLFQQVKRAAYQIIDKKGHTNWAIGLVIASIIRSIKEDQRRILPITVRLNGEYGIDRICLSLPAIVGLNGVERYILPELSQAELKGIQVSAKTLQEPVAALNLN